MFEQGQENTFVLNQLSSISGIPGFYFIRNAKFMHLKKNLIVNSKQLNFKKIFTKFVSTTFVWKDIAFC